jgi:hypothetical protein
MISITRFCADKLNELKSKKSPILIAHRKQNFTRINQNEIGRVRNCNWV